MRIEGTSVFLKVLSPDDVDDAYIRWMQDSEVLQYLESRWRRYTRVDLVAYVQEMNRSTDNLFLGIYLRAGDRHIGNIRIGDINHVHRFASIGILIGEKDLWGKGYGSEAIRLASDYAFRELNLHSLTAGVYEDNRGSCAAFLRAGFREVGRYQKRRILQGKYVDEIILEKVRDEPTG